MTYIPRLLEEEITPFLQSNKILILLGARQVGKTTIIKHLLKERSGTILNMDIKIDRDRLHKAAAIEPKEGIRTLSTGELLIIDEAQRVKDIGRITKGWYDRDVDKKIILLGSSSANLLDLATGELVGRNEKLWLTPLLFREVLSQQEWYTKGDTADQIQKYFPDQVKSILLERIIFGSYPDAYLSGNTAEYLTTLSTDYLFKDVFGMISSRATEDIRSLLVELIRETGETVSYLQLSTRLKISRQTVQKYLRLLEEAFIIFSLPSYATDPNKETHKSYKYYFWDNGVRNALIGDWTVSQDRTDIDKLWENWVLAEIKKISMTLRRPEELYFWQSRHNSNVELVIRQGNTLHPFNISFYENNASLSRAFTNMYNVKPELIHPDNVLNLLI